MCDVILWGIEEVELGEVVELFSGRGDAEQTLRDVLRDEPTWSRLLRVEPVDLEMLGAKWTLKRTGSLSTLTR
jgi:hypothetical protein